MKKVVTAFCMGLAACSPNHGQTDNGTTANNAELADDGIDAPKVDAEPAPQNLQPHEGFSFAYSHRADADDKLLFAAADKLTAEFQRCDASGDDPNIECESAELDRQDVRLNAVYQQVMSRLPSLEKEQLRALQRKWLREVDLHCETEASEVASGSLAERIVYCKTIEKIHRTIWLKDYKAGA